MPARVAPAPIPNSAMSTPTATGPLGDGRRVAAPSPQPPSDASDDYLSLLDGLLDQFCCAGADSSDCDTSGIASRSGNGMEVEHEPQPQHPQRQSQQPQQPPSTVSLPPSTRSRSNASQQSSLQNSTPHNPDTIILPHLRFCPLPTPPSLSGYSSSSLQVFFDLFLADNAPHSFQLFHESNGDQNVRISPWKNVMQGTTGSREVGRDDNREERRRMERTVRFLTKITPGTSSNPLSQSERLPHAGTATIPLQVTILQSLVMLNNRWMLQCDFSFEFDSFDNSARVGRKFGAGLGQYLISNVIKTSLVSVIVTLSECCDEKLDINGARSVTTQRRRTSSGTYQHPGCKGNTKRVTASNVPPSPTGRISCGDEGLRWCFSHPLLLADGLCTGSVVETRDEGNTGDNTITSSSCKEDGRDTASHVGASLLSAIQAKNTPSGSGEVGRPRVWNAAATRPTSAQPPNKTFGGNVAERCGKEDVLACSSTALLKTKRISSFDIERAPSTVSGTVMRRMLLEKDCASVRSRDTGYGLLLTPSFSSSRTQRKQSSRLLASNHSPHGFSMQIHMEIDPTMNSDSNTLLTNLSTASSLSSTFSRSTSITGIDEKIRRGLKKRIARSWICWAESWCMRHWEEGGTLPPPLVGGRKKFNVRPQVRRISEAKKSSEEEAKKIAKKEKTSTNTVWKMQMEKGTSFRQGLWMSFDDFAEEHGVEVSCTKPLSSSSLPSVALTESLSSSSKTTLLSRSWSLKSNGSGSQSSCKCEGTKPQSMKKCLMFKRG